jgi:hypothetical protein
MPLGLFDLTIVTDRLTGLLGIWSQFPQHTQIDPGHATIPYAINYTGLAPEAARELAKSDTTSNKTCQVSVYLFHVAADKSHRNTFPLGGTAQRIPEQPLALTLYYLVTAYSHTAGEAAFIEEQEAMSIVLKCFHENPIVQIPENGGAVTVTLEPQTVDEIGRLWQGLGSPMRLGAVYRVGVIFLQPPDDPIEPGVVRHPANAVVDTLENVSPAPPVGPFAEALPADETGLTIITAPDATFTAATPAVKIRARPLTSSSDDPLPSGCFRVTSGTTIALRVPLFTPKDRYLLSVQDTPDGPLREAWLDVPEAVVVVPVDGNGFATIIADDARFVTGQTTVLLGDPPGTPLVGVAMGTLALQSGQFSVVIDDGDTIRLRIPSATPSGRRFLSVLRTPPPPPLLPPLELWLDVP